jgi:hypothetical protein
VYAAIDSERDYHERRWVDARTGGKNHEIAAWITYMRAYIDEAAGIASHASPETAALDSIRKVCSLGVACMEEHGAPMRNGCIAVIV